MSFQTSLHLVHKSGHSPRTQLCGDVSWNPAPSHPTRLCGFQMLGTAVAIYKQQVTKDPMSSGCHSPSIGTEMCFSRKLDSSFLSREALSFHMNVGRKCFSQMNRIKKGGWERGWTMGWERTCFNVSGFVTYSLDAFLPGHILLSGGVLAGLWVEKQADISFFLTFLLLKCHPLV